MNKILKVLKVTFITIFSIFAAVVILGILLSIFDKPKEQTENTQQTRIEIEIPEEKPKEENLSLKISGGKISIQDRLIKGGKMGYIAANKGTITESDLIQFYNEISKSEYKYIIIHFMEDNTALHLIPRIGSISYGTYDRANLCLKSDLGWMSIIGNSATKENWPNNIFRN